MSTRIFEKIKKKEKIRQELLSQLLTNRKMVRGSFCQIYVRCGRKACWCYLEKGHPHKRMSLHENGKNFSRAVPVEEHVWITEMTESYREYRLLRRALTKLENEIKHLLDRVEEQCLKKTKKGKKYLDVSEAISEEKSKKSSGTSNNERS